MIGADLYDYKGDVVEVPFNHIAVIGINSVCFIPVDDYSAKLVYRPPPKELNEED